MTLRSRGRIFEEVCLTLAWEHCHARMKLKRITQGPRYLSFDFRLLNPLLLDKVLKLTEPIGLSVGVQQVFAQPKEAWVNFQYQIPKIYWKDYVRSDLPPSDEVGVGIGEGDKLITYNFDPPHSLIAGQTQVSGKTTTTQSIVCGSMLRYTPDKLGVLICDSHRDHIAFEGSAHLVYPLAHDKGEIDQAIDFLDNELAQRKGHNARNAKPWIIVIEEAETELKDKRRREVIEAIGREAAKYKMHLIVTTQKPKVANIGDLIDNLGDRWIGKVSNADVSHRLSGVAGLACQQLTPRGDFMHLGGEADVERVQVAMAMESDFAKLPRAEIIEPEVLVSDTPRVLNFEEPKKRGAPTKSIEPKKIATYLLRRPTKITEDWAREHLGLKRHTHIKHQNFALELDAELKRLYGMMVR